jgi:GNAT superfamily N-acetyltransferase
MTLTVRPLGIADQAAWRALWAAYLAFYETEVSETVRDTAFARLLSDDPHEFCGLIAEAGGRPVGLVHYLFHRHGWRIEPVCYLQDLYVAPGARGRGVGRALIMAVYAAADAAGAPAVYWLTQHFNAPARALYDQVGTSTPFVKYVRPGV